MSRYLLSGIPPEVICSTISPRRVSFRESENVPHSDRFIIFRAPVTSLQTPQEIGATWLYQGHRVRFEWQSWQERSKMAATCGGTGVAAANVFEGSTGGFVRGTGMNCATTRSTSNAQKIRRSDLRMIISPALLNSRMSNLRSRVGHVLRADEFIEFLCGEIAKLDDRFAEAEVFVMRFLGGFGGPVVADARAQSGDQHQRILHVKINLLGVGLNADGAVVHETVAGVRKQLDGVEEIENHHRLENVELEIALRAGKADGGVVAHHLDGDHGHGLGLRGIDLAGHDARAGLVFRKRELAEAAARAGGQPANVVGDFHERSGERFQRAAGENDFVVRGERGEFIRMRAEGKAGQLGDFARGALGEFGVRVEAGADGGAADGEIVEAVESHGDAGAIAVEEIDIAGEFLAESERGGILQMRAADLHDVREFFG